MIRVLLLLAAVFGAVPLANAAAATNWIAYNDYVPSATTHANANTYNLRGVAGTPPEPTTGFLKDFLTGAETPAFIIATATGAPDYFGGISYPAAGTPAYNLFNGIVDLGNVNSAIGIRSSANSTVTLTFSNLNPSQTYIFRGTVVRGGSGGTYSRRWTLASLRDADSFTDAHTAGVYTRANFPTGTMTNGQAAWNSGVNVTEGSLVGWDNIVPGADGVFTIKCEQYVDNPLPNGEAPDLGTYGYSLTGIYLAEIGEPRPVTIIVEPLASVSIEQNRPLNLSVSAAGAPAPTYQWYREGLGAIAGATARTFSIPMAQPADSGNYFVVAANSINSATSRVASVTVYPDTNGPVLLSTRSDASFSRIILSWDELISLGPVQELGNYHLYAGDGSEIANAVALATLVNGTNVVLDLSTPLVLDGVYSLEIDFQADVIPNPTIKVGNPVFDTESGIVTSVRPFVISRGFALKELYLGLSASSVAISDLRNSPKYPNSPDIVRYGQLLELNTFDEFEGYGARMSGFLLPPVSGPYTFYLASDDSGELWLSTDASPANLVNIALEPVWTNRRQWTGLTRSDASDRGVANPSPSGGPQANISGPISLEAGQIYYFETLVKEGGGGDNLAVAWQIPGGSVPANGDLPIPGALIASLADPVGASLTIANQPLGTNVQAGETATLSITASGVYVGGVAPLNYQWQINSGGVFTDILGAYGSSYTTTPLGAGENRQYRALVFIPGASATSAVAAVTVGAAQPRLNIARDAGAVTLSWSGTARLQFATSLTSPINWQDIDTGGASTYTVYPSNEFNVNLDSAQAGGGGRTGSGSGTVNFSGSILKVDVTYSGLSADRSADHFHAPAPRGGSAGVVYDLGAITTGTRAGTIKGDVTLVDAKYDGKSIAAQVQDIRNGLWYLNIHSAGPFSNGEIRGQVEPGVRFYRLATP